MLWETGCLADKERQRTPYKIPDEELKTYIAENPDAYFTGIAVHFSCSNEGIRRACKRLGITRKKKTKSYILMEFISVIITRLSHNHG